MTSDLQPLPRRRFLENGLAALAGISLGPLFITGAEAKDGSSTLPLDRSRIKVLLDSDIGSDIDDATCLAYLLAQPRCELMGVTIVTGESVRRAELASSLCRAAGADIPIYPGAEKPLLVSQRQPVAEQAVLLGDISRKRNFPQGQAVDFARDVIRSHPGEIELLAVGPLTNIALLFASDPEISGLLRGLTLMCGKFVDYPSPWGLTEWNAVLDPHATAITYRHKCRRHRSVGLDVTLQVAMKPESVAERFGRHPLLQLVHRFSRDWFERRELLHFHDALAAISLFNEDVCAFVPGQVRVALDAGDELGRTLWNRTDAGGPHEVALKVDPELFFKEYFSVFS